MMGVPFSKMVPASPAFKAAVAAAAVSKSSITKPRPRSLAMKLVIAPNGSNAARTSSGAAFLSTWQNTPRPAVGEAAAAGAAPPFVAAAPALAGRASARFLGLGRCGAGAAALLASAAA